jgi:transcriptional regulator with PAS, ATPase and Fis domain
LHEESTILGRRCFLVGAGGHKIPVLKNAREMRDQQGRLLGGIESVTDISGLLELEKEVDILRKEVSGRARFQRIIGRHPQMHELYEMIELAARSTSSVLIQGETGTGKELVAHAIHHSSGRRAGPFVRVSCAALSETLLESELFGHVRGAFTGAVANRKGRFEAADTGTLFLDEIGDISPAIQTKLLRVLQEREIERVGENRTIPIDIRVISATNQNLLALCDAGEFRRDLYYRLCVIPLEVPALRTRRSDIPLLIEHFISALNRSMGRVVEGVDPAAMQRLVDYEWPGNIRELENAVEYSYVLCRGNILELQHFPPGVAHGSDAQPSTRRTHHRGRVPEKAQVIAALRASDGSRLEAAAALGVSRVTLWKWMRAMDIDYPTSRES